MYLFNFAKRKTFVTLLSVFLYLQPTAGFSQTNNKKWQLTVIDSIKLTPIQYATISLNKKKYFSLDENGGIDMDVELIEKGDSIRISSIGYTTKIIVVDSTGILPRQIQLNADVQQLDEVTISNTKPKEFTIGKKGLFLKWAFITALKTKYAEFIPNKAEIQGAIIEAIEFNLSNNDNNNEPFKVNLYSKLDSSKYPYKTLIDDDIIIKNLDKKKKVIVDIKKYQIPFPSNGVFIVAETLSRDYYSPEKFHKFELFPRVTPSFFTYKDQNEGDGYSLIEALNWHIFEFGNNFLFRLKIITE